MMYLRNNKSDKGLLSDKTINPLSMSGVSAVIVSDDSISSIQRFVRKLPVGLLITLSDITLFEELHYDQDVMHNIIIIYTKKHSIYWNKFIDRLRSSHPNTLTIFVMISEHEESMIEFLRAGVDECFTHNTLDTEIKLRLYARCEKPNKPILTSQSSIIVMDLDNELRINGVKKFLTSKEYKLARMLFKKIGLIISREELCMSIWGKEVFLVGRSLDVHVSRLREKLLLNTCTDLRIVSVYKKGYKMEFRSI